MCTRLPKEGNYKFFEKIGVYIEKAKSAENSSSSDRGYTDCDDFSMAWKSSFKDTQIAKNICKEFIILYNSLNNLKAKSTTSTDYKDECEFFNYWVNFKISENMINERDCVEKIYNAFESYCTKDFGVQFDENIIYNINKDDLYQMNILYSLYNKYTGLDTMLKDTSQVDKHSLLNLSTACCPDYIKASYMCNNDNEKNNPKFCDKLNTFKSKHDALYKEVVAKGSDFSDYFIELSKCPNTKIITTAVTGSIVGLIPLLGVLYKFTPMGQVLRSKIGILNNDISNNDEEMIKMSLMEQENGQLKYQQGKYNIKYQSL